MINTIPFAFDSAFYIRKYEDLRDLSAEAAAEHFSSYGISEGRQGHPRGSRPAFTDYINTFDSVLEIGPFCNPVARGNNVRYLDVLDEVQLRERAKALNIDPAGCPERIHYFNDIFEIKDTFDVVVSSHCIEHQPDLVHHLEGVARVLRPGGLYILYVPDKRYCFDHFNPESTVAEVVDAHSQRRTAHVLRSVIEHHALTTHNDAQRHWAGDHGMVYGDNLTARIKAALDLYLTSKTYIDVHAWYFTPQNFLEIMTALVASGYSELRPVENYTTLLGDLEFFAVLQRA